MIARKPEVVLALLGALLAPGLASAQAIEISPEWRVKTTQRVRPPARSSYIPSSDLAPQAPPEAGSATQPVIRSQAAREPAPAMPQPLPQPQPARHEAAAPTAVTASSGESGRLDFLFRN